MAKNCFRKALLIVLAFVVLLVTVGCETTTKTFPIVYTHSPSTEFEILGTVSVRSSQNVGYNTVLEEARSRFPSTDFVIDIMIDEHEITTSYHWFAYLFRLIFSANMRQQHTRYEYTISGTAIKYIRNINEDVNYNIGGIGPSGGIIFFDKGFFGDGWRYLEAAPANREFNARWNNAHQQCAQLNINGFIGWRLPTKEELDLMYKNLKQEGLGGFQAGRYYDSFWYWSSSELNNHNAWRQNFSDGKQSANLKRDDDRVRAVRSF